MSGDVDLPIQGSLNEHCISVLDKSLTPVQRMVVSNDGTVQKLLTAHFGTEVHVSVNHQIDVNGLIVRNSVLYINEDDATCDVCLATSVIRTSNSDYVKRIRMLRDGIGFILNDMGILTRREILDIHVSEEVFRRVYRIYNTEHEIDIIITETFPTKLFT